MIDCLSINNYHSSVKTYLNSKVLFHVVLFIKQYHCLSCSCGNVNWARRMDCNVCNTPKFGTVEPRTGMQYEDVTIVLIIIYGNLAALRCSCNSWCMEY